MATSRIALNRLFALAAMALTSVCAWANESYPPIFEPHATVLFQGDSITDGNRGRTADPNHILGHGYAFTIASKYGATYPERDLTFLNRGVSGNRVQDLAARWDGDTLALKPTVLSILIGINDIYAALNSHQPFDAKPVAEAYDALLSQTTSLLPGVKLVLCEPFTLDVGIVAKNAAPWHKAVADLDAEVEKLAVKYHVPVVRLQQVFDEATKRAPADHWIWDGIHPTYSGHQLIADAWVSAYNAFYVSPLVDPERNSAISPTVSFERDSYDWIHRHDDVLDIQKKVQPDVVMLGDSITHFWGGEPDAHHSNGPKAWAATFGSLKVINMGFGWDRTQNVLWRLQHGEFVGLAPKTIVLNIGTNNLVGDSTARLNSPEEVAVGVEAILRILHERSPQSKIFLMAVFPRGFERGNSLDQSIQALNAILLKDAANLPQVTFLDIRSKLLNATGTLSPSIMFDGTHPTEDGYAIWGQALKEAGAIPQSLNKDRVKRMEREDVIGYQRGTARPKPAWLQDRLEWFQDQKFGLILHWAPYALWDCCESWPISPGDPWARADDMECWTSRGKNFEVFQRDYWNLNREFNPIKFDPKEWARIAKVAGARYLAFTTKHHDGFCMWDTQTTDYKVTGPDCPFHSDSRADAFKQICNAFQDEGLAISAYFSKADWHCPHYWSPLKPVETRGANTVDDPDEWAKFVAYTHEQIRELMTGYGKIDVLWLDGGWVKDGEDIDMPGLAALARELQPGLIIANRTVGDDYEDFVTPEREIPEEPLGVPWESCLVMAENWKYNPRDKYRPCEDILEMLVDTISKGGNLLLGLGPTPEGEFPPEAIERLETIGRWMDINAEAVYESRAIKPYREGDIRFTQRAGFVYAFSFDAEDVVLRSFRPEAGSVTLLGYQEPVEVKHHADGVILRSPKEAKDLPLPLVYRLTAGDAP